MVDFAGPRDPAVAPAPLPHDGTVQRNELIFQCIMSDQVPEDELGALMEDAEFRAYFEQRIRVMRAPAAVPPHAAGLLSGLAAWFQGWRRREAAPERPPGRG